MKTISRYIMTLALLITAATGAWAQDDELLTTITPDGSGNIVYSVADIATLDKGNALFENDKGWYMVGGNAYLTVTVAEGINVTKVKFTTCNNDSWEDTEAPYQVKLSGGHVYNASSQLIGYGIGVTKIEVYAAAGPEVTLNEAKTEASFDMPAFDATADYELVRDMSIQMTAQVGDGTQEQPRYRVKKDGNNKFIPADMEMAAVPALFTVNDAIEQKALTQTDYIVQIYAIDEQTGQPTGEAMTLATFTFEPGIYAVKAVAAQGSDYDGETALSNTFKLFQGYEIEVAAGEYATFFKDEALYVEDEDAQLYTITDVNGDKATATELTTAPAYTPLLVKNTSEETKTILLIPTTDHTPDDVTKYVGFVGTTIPTEIAASDDTFNRYAFNGLQFVWVKNVIAIAANKCWLEVPVEGGRNALALRIVFGNEATGIGSVLNRSAADEWYDLSGRKLTRKPTVKGVYILNGRKVVVK